MGADVFAACKENIDKKVDDIIQKTKEEEKEYLKLKEKANKLILSKTNIKELSNNKLKVILKSLKRNGNPALLTKKKDMLESYKEWKDHDNNEDPNHGNEELNIGVV